jgi:hypothetical protein
MIYIFGIYTYDENGKVKTQKEIKLKAKDRGKAYDKAKSKYPYYFVELNKLQSDTKN